MGSLAENLELKLESKGIHTLRQIGRVVGVSNPTTKKKDELVRDIMAIAKNLAEPCPRSTRGAPPKTEEYDRELVDEIERLRQQSVGEEEQKDMGEYMFSSPSSGEDEEKQYSGVLENADKFWFVRTQNMQISSYGDVFVHSSFVTRFHLRVGDYIVCRAKRRKQGECPGATYIVSVNGRSPELARSAPFESLTPCYPDRRFTLEYEGCSLTERVIDVFSPVGLRQRALLVSPPKAGKTTMLKTVARAICKNYPQAKVIVLLIDERPEEVTDFRRSVEGAMVVYSTFDKGDSHHIHTASLTLEHAKRLVETGMDVVILMDSITRLTRAYNAVCNSGRTLSGGLDPQALVEPKRFFGAARNIENGGSLTIIATALIDTGSRLDDVIYEEFKSTGNMEIVLSRDMAERRIFPAVDIRASGARKEELLLSEDELRTAAMIRGLMAKKLTAEEVFASMEKTASNAEFLSKAQAFFKVYNGR